GNLYLNVINSVINESRMDFEDSGIDEATLQELRTVWQDRLSGLNVATMPWDPAPAAAVPQANDTGLLPDTFKDESLVKQEPLENTQSPLDQAAQQQSQQQPQPRLETPPVHNNGATNNNSNNNNNNSNNNNGGLVLPGGGQMTQADGAA